MALAETTNIRKFRSVVTAVIAMFTFAVACWVAWPRGAAPVPAASFTPTVASLPSPAPAVSAPPALHFEPNRGQADPSVQYLARGKGFVLYLRPDEVVFVTRASAAGSDRLPQEQIDREDASVEATETHRSVIRMSFPGARPSPEIVGLEEQPGRSNYFLGGDPQEWRTGVPHYGEVRYRNLYPGVDLVLYARREMLEYDFVVAAGATAEPIRIRFEGAESLSVNEAGALSLAVSGGALVQGAPVVFQRLNGQEQEVAGRYVIEQPGEVRFVLGDYDPGRELVIDPAVIFSDYLGGSGEDFVEAISIDMNGNPVVVGWTESANFPLVNPIDNTLANRDIFIMKRSGRDGSTLFSTLIGGSSADEPRDVVVDRQGRIWVTGVTFSSDFPTPNALDGTFGGFQDGFALSINATGSSLDFSTFIGGTNTETGTGIAVNGSGSVFVTGVTDSTDFLTVGAEQGTLAGGQDFFFQSFNPGPYTLGFSSYFGGTDTEWEGLGVIDYSASPASHNWLVAGTTSSTDMLTVVAVQPTNAGGKDFVMTLVDSAGDVQVSTYYGGSGDEVFFQALQREHAWETLRGWTASGDNVCVGGSTSSPFLPPSGGAISGPDDAFITCVDPATLAPISGIVFGGGDTDRITELVMGVGEKSNFSAPFPTGPRVIVFGETGSSADFPTRNAFQKQYGGGLRDSFVAEIDGLLPGSGPTRINSASFYGGSGSEIGFSGTLFFDGNERRIYIAGSTTSVDILTNAALQGTHAGGTWDTVFYTLLDTFHVFPGDNTPEPATGTSEPRQ